MTKNTIETIKYRNYTIEAALDYDYPFNPSEDSRLIKYCLSHGRYDLANDTDIKPGDGQPPYEFDIPADPAWSLTYAGEALSSEAWRLIGEARDRGDDYISFYLDGWEAVRDALLLTYPDIEYIAVVDMYDHSRQSLHLCGYSGPDARWDSGTVGFAFLTASDIKEWYDNPQVTADLLEKAKTAAKRQFALYNDWILGDIYSYLITDSDGETVDACGGWFGSDYNRMLEDAKAGINRTIKKKLSDHHVKLKGYIQLGVAIQYRQALSL